MQLDLSAQKMRSALLTGRGALTWQRAVLLIVICLAALAWGLSASASIRYGLVLTAVYGIAILGNNAIVTTLREINLGIIAPIAVGAYVSAWFMNSQGSVLLGVVLAIVLSAAVSLVLAMPTTSLKGVQTALVTFALAFAIHDLIIFLEPVTGGDQGVYVELNSTLAGLTFAGSSYGMLLLALLCFLVCGLLHIYLISSKPGRLAIGVGEAERATAVFGVHTRWVKVAVWTWAGALGGLSGFLYGLAVGYLSPTQFGIMLSVFLFVGGFIGGARSAIGALIGGLLVGALPNWLQNYVPIWATTIAYGFILLAALMTGGRGVAQAFETGILSFLYTRNAR